MTTGRRPARINVRALVILVLVTGLLAGGAAVAYKARKRIVARRALASGRAALQNENWAEACKHLRVYLAKYPEDMEVLARFAEANRSVRPQQLKNIAAAIGAYRRLLRRQPGDDELCAQLSKLYCTVRDFKEAAYVCRQRLEVDPADADAAVWLGKALVAQSKYDEASEVLIALTEVHPGEVDAYALLSTLAVGQGSVSAKDEALRWLDQGVENNPQSAKMRALRARFHRTVRRDGDVARADLETAARLGTDDPSVLLLMTEEWLNLGDLDRAQGQLELLRRLDAETLAAHDTHPDDLALGEFLMAGRLALLQGARAVGVELANRALAPVDLPAHRRVALLPLAIELYLAADDVDRARTCLEQYRAAQLEAGGDRGSPTDDVALLTALVASADDRPYDVINVLEPFVAAAPENARAWMLLGAAYERTGQSQRAAMAWGEYLGRVPGDFATTVRAARALSRRDPATALRYATRAERLRPDDVEAKLLRIEAEIYSVVAGATEAGRAPQLAEELLALRRTHPDSARTRILLASIAAEEGRVDEAIAEFERILDGDDETFAAAWGLVRCYRSLGRVDDAVAACQKAISQHRDLALPRLLLAEVQTAAERIAAARDTLEQAVMELSAQEQLTAQIALAEFVVRHGAAAESLALLEALAAEHSNNARLRVRLLSLAEVQSDTKKSQRLVDEIRVIEGEQGLLWRLEQAKVWLREAEWKQRQPEIEGLLDHCIRASPAWSAPVLALGGMYERLGDKQKAETTYRRSVDAHAGNVDVAGRLLGLLAGQQRFSEADAIVARLPKRAPGLSKHRVGIAIGRGNYEVAIEELQGKAAASPDDATSRVMLARLLYGHRGDVDGALALLEEARAAAPELRAIVSAKAAILHAEGRDDEVEALLDAQVDGRNDFAAYLLRAEYYATVGRLDDAEKDYIHLTTLSDRAAEGYAALGVFHEKVGRPDDAVAAWRAGLDHEPEDPGLRFLLAKSLARSRDPQSRREGLKTIDELLAGAPDDVSLLSLRAAVLLEEHTPEANEAAAQVLERVLRIDPRNINAHRVLVRLAREAGDSERAGALVARALGSAPDDPVLRTLRAGLEAQAGNEAIARELARSVLETDPHNVMARNLLAELALRAGDVESAGRLNSEAVGVAPTDETAQVMRARILDARGEREHAIEALQAYCDTDAGRRSTPTRVTLAILHMQEGDFSTASELLKEAQEIAPRDQTVVRARLQWLALQRRFDEIVAALDSPPDGRPAGASMLTFGASLLASAGNEERLREAKRLFEQAGTLDPNRIRAHLGLAQVAYRLGDIAGTEQAYRRILERAPYHQQALNDLAWILNANLGNAEQALELADRGVARYPDDPHLLDTRGVVLAALGRVVEARADFEKCLELARGIPSTRASALFHLGRLLVKQGELTAALPRLREALLIDEKQRVLSDDDRAEIERLIDQTSRRDGELG